MEQHDFHCDKRQFIMHRIFLIREARTEHAKQVRKLTGRNDFRDKQVPLIFAHETMQCIGTFLTTDNLIGVCYK